MTDPTVIVTRYLAALHDGRWEDAADCFTDDAFYSHPALPEDPPRSPRRESHGRAEMIAFFRLRGPRPGRHFVDHWATRDGVTYVKGHVLDPQGNLTVTYVSEVRLAEDGRISYYAGYSARPPVGAAAPRDTGQA